MYIVHACFLSCFDTNYSEEKLELAARYDDTQGEKEMKNYLVQY
jgi:hypothetical protein